MAHALGLRPSVASVRVPRLSLLSRGLRGFRQPRGALRLGVSCSERPVPMALSLGFCKHSGCARPRAAASVLMGTPSPAAPAGAGPCGQQHWPFLLLAVPTGVALEPRRASGPMAAVRSRPVGSWHAQALCGLSLPAVIEFTSREDLRPAADHVQRCPRHSRTPRPRCPGACAAAGRGGARAEPHGPLAPVSPCRDAKALPAGRDPGLRGFARRPRGQAGKSRPHRVWALEAGGAVGMCSEGRPQVALWRLSPRGCARPLSSPGRPLAPPDPELVSGQLCSKACLQAHTPCDPSVQAEGRLWAPPCRWVV